MPIKHPAHERGANIVEAALVIPLLLIILVGVIDMGRAYFTYITMIGAAREGARWGVTHPSDTSGMCGKVTAEAQGNGIVDPTAWTCTPTPGGASGSPVRVTVQTTFRTILGSIVGRPTFPIRYSVAFPVR
jgi:Flp pilus assembly protein TadG